MTENEMNIIEAEDEMELEDTTEYLEAEEKRRKREGQLEDVPAMQGVICIVLAVGLVLLNFKFPEMAEEIFHTIKENSLSEKAIIGNPIDALIEFIEKICRK